MYTINLTSYVLFELIPGLCFAYVVLKDAIQRRKMRREMEKKMKEMEREPVHVVGFH